MAEDDRDIHPSVAELVRTVSGLARETKGELTADIQRIFDALLSRTDLITLGVPRSSAHGLDSNWLYYDTEIAVSFGKARDTRVPAHDHGTWQLLAVYQGSLEYLGYRHELGDAGHASLEVTTSVTAGQGEIIKIGAPPDDVHEWVALEPDTYILGVYPTAFTPVRKYFRGNRLGSGLQTGNKLPSRYFERPETGFGG